MLNTIEVLEQLVSIPSVNPMGADGSGPEFGEGRLTAHLESLFEGLGLHTMRQPALAGRENLLARLDGEVLPEQGGRLLLFGVHQDTVPVGGMTIDPFAPEIREGRLYGRGACDVKGGMAAIVAAVARLAEERPRGMPSVVVACTVNEEYGFDGAKAVSRALAEGDLRFFGRVPEAAVVAEPTGMDLVVAHKGVVRWRCHAPGHAAHSAQPEAGDNAIYKMARALRAMEHFQKKIVGKLGAHPTCGAGTMSVGTIGGGISVNTVPGRCTVEIDRRFPPGESAEEARGHLVEYLAEEADLGFSLEHDPPYMQGMALSDAKSGPLADRLAEIVRAVAGDCRQIGVPYATDAAFFSAVGIPTVVFGPGSIDQAHTADEWVSLDQLEQATESYYRLAVSTATP